MNFLDHSKIKGSHAMLGASKFAWLNYTPDKLATVYFNSYAQTIGTIIHDLACKLIKDKMKIGPEDRNLLIFHLRENRVPEFVISNLDIDFMLMNLGLYVNDAIQLDMTPEVILYYSDNCFGTADAISFNRKKLRIHDLKSGVTEAHWEQLQIYAALFCLEYKVKPKDIKIELRLYQNCEPLIFEPAPEDIMAICDKIVQSNNIIEELKTGRKV